MDIGSLISASVVKAPLVASDKRGAIDELIDLLADANKVLDSSTVKAVVWEREEQRSTGIGEGLAIPHGRIEGLETIVLAIGRPAAPIDFDACDQKPVQLIILMLSPSDQTGDHIQTLGKISRMMADNTFRKKAYSAQSGEELHALFTEPANC